MAKKLYVVLPDTECREIQEAARAGQLSLAEWVRQALIDACGRETQGDVEKKFAAIRIAVQYECPTADHKNNAWGD